MATATNKPKASPIPATGAVGSRTNPVLRAFDAVYRFLASVKLAVITLGSLAAALGYATFFEKWYGTPAAQEWIYRSPEFAVLLAFLGANILCAATIRFPWKRRQTGFVVTHLGLLILLAGSWYSMLTKDEGVMAALEGQEKQEFVRTERATVRVRQVDPADPHAFLREWELPFHPGTFGWGAGKPKPHSTLAAPFHWNDDRNPTETLTQPADPFRFVVKSHMPTSIRATRHVASPDGWPMVKIRPEAKPPGQPARDVLEPRDRWFVTENRLYRVVRAAGPAQFAFTYVSRPELVDDFLNPPAAAGDQGVALIHYQDKDGKARRYDFSLDGPDAKGVTLPDSDLRVSLLAIKAFPSAELGLGESSGDPNLAMPEFEVRRGENLPVKHFALANLPMLPNVLPTPRPEGSAPAGPPPTPLVGINYFVPPTLDLKGNGLLGVAEVLGTPEGALYYRVFGRGEPGLTQAVVRSKGPVTRGEPVVAFGGNDKLPMTLSFRVEDYLPSGVEKDVCEAIELPKNEEGFAASEVEMTVPDPHDPSKSETQNFFIRRTESFEPVWQTVRFHDATYQVSYDVERVPLDFSIKLLDFQRKFNPGTEQASQFASKIELTDPKAGLKAKPVTISMNEPLSHRGYKFYQSKYVRERDLRNPDEETGRVYSIFQVGVNPGLVPIYLGCALVVLGSFLQFYMRAGLFSDAGRRAHKTAVEDAGGTTGRAPAGGEGTASGRRAPTPGDVDDIL